MGWTDDFVVADDTYGDGSDYATLFSYRGADEHVVIPEYVDAIAKGAFRDNTHTDGRPEQRLRYRRRVVHGLHRARGRRHPRADANH